MTAEPQRVVLELLRRARLQHGFPNHTLCFGDSKLRQNSRGNIGQGGSVRCNLAVAQQDPRDECVVHAMIAAPWVRVIFEFFGRERTENGLPSSTVTAVVTNEHVWT